MLTICPVCKTQNAEENIVDLNEINFTCPKCGAFKLSHDVNHNLNTRIEPNQKISSWISEQNKIYHVYMPYIDLEKLDSISNQRNKTIREKFDMFMKVLVRKPRELKLYHFNECYINDDKEFVQLILKAQNEGFIYECIGSETIKTAMEQGSLLLYYKGLTFEGQEYIESLDTPNKNSNKIFMAFWFNLDIQNIFDDIVKPAIDEVGFLAERVSSSTTNLENKISDEIIGMIKSSRAVIADCTGNRTAVYYEAGYAMGMKIPVIWTCKADQVADICFDVSQHPFILWSTPEELADKIVKRLKAIL